MKRLKIENFDLDSNQNGRIYVWLKTGLISLFLCFLTCLVSATWKVIQKTELIKEKFKIVVKCFPCWFMFGVMPKIIIECLISTFSMQLVDSQLNQMFIFGYILFGFLISDLLRI